MDNYSILTYIDTDAAEKYIEAAYGFNSTEVSHTFCQGKLFDIMEIKDMPAAKAMLRQIAINNDAECHMYEIITGNDISHILVTPHPLHFINDDIADIIDMGYDYVTEGMYELSDYSLQLRIDNQERDDSFIGIIKTVHTIYTGGRKRFIDVEWTIA